MRKCMPIFILALLLALIFVPATHSDAASEKIADVDIYTFVDSVSVSAGGKTDMEVSITNLNASQVSVKLVSESDSEISVTFDKPDLTIAKGKSAIVKAIIKSDEFAKPGDFKFSIIVKVYNFSTHEDGSLTLPMKATIINAHVSGDSFNKIFGIFENPFHETWIAALLTLAIWIGLIVLFIVFFSFVLVRFFHTDKEEHRSLMIRSGSMISIAILLQGITKSLEVYGVSTFVIVTMSNITADLYILIFAYIIWNIFDIAVKRQGKKIIEKRSNMDASILLLINILGKLTILTVSIASFLATVGMNLVALLTGAGVIGMAVSLGAQNIISEFFAGLTLMITRPFQPGDMVRIGSDENIYEVIKIRTMNTEFKNWASLEHITMPNSTVSGSRITNITGKSSAYRLFLYYEIDYDADIDKAKKVLLDAAYAHPQIIKDGSYSKPNVRVNNFNEFGIELRLAVYITNFLDNITVTDELNEVIYKNLEDNEVEIPFEKYDVYLKDERQ